MSDDLSPVRGLVFYYHVNQITHIDIVRFVVFVEYTIIVSDCSNDCNESDLVQ